MKNDTDGISGERGNAVAVIGGTIIDGNGGTPVDDGVILIDGKQITAIGDRSIPIPPHANQISATGKFVIPGLMDSFQYVIGAAWPPDLVRCEGRYDEVAIEVAQLALKGGITTVFDALGPRDALIKARNAINEGLATGARIGVCGNWIGCGGPYSPDLNLHGNEVVGDLSESKLNVANSAVEAAFAARINALWEVNVGEELTRMPLEEARQEICKYVESGIDFVSYLVNAHRLGAYQYIAFSPRVQRMIVEEAHRVGLPVKAFFASTEEGIHMALDAGADLIAPAPGFGGKRMSAETLALIAQREIPVFVISTTTADLEWYRRQPPNALYPPLLKSMEESDVNLRGLIRSGARIITWTSSMAVSPDQLKVLSPGLAPGSFAPLGEGHIRSFQAVQEKGVAPLNALTMFTRNVAQAYKVDKDLGTLDRGKLADLVILDRNPLENPQNYLAIHLVMKEGKVIDRDALPTQRLWTAPSLLSH